MKSKLNRMQTGGRVLLVGMTLFLVATLSSSAQVVVNALRTARINYTCGGTPQVDITAVSVNPIPGTILLGQPGVIEAIVTNDPVLAFPGCDVPTNEFVVSVSFSATYLTLVGGVGAPSFTTDCPGIWTASATLTAGTYNVTFINTGGPILGATGCTLDINVIGAAVTPVGAPPPVNMNVTITPIGGTSSDLNGSNNTASGVVTVAAASLPIRLNKFLAAAQACSGNLSWTTSLEENFNRFEVEFSRDGSNYTSVGNLQSQRNANGSTYNFSYVQGNSSGFYRLKMVDDNGTFSYSKTIPISAKCNGRVITIHPNPVRMSNILTVNVSGYGDGNLKGELIAQTGQVIKTYSLKNGSNNLPIAELAQATYMLRVTETGGASESFKVVIIK